MAYYRKKNIKWFFLRGPHKAALAEAYVRIFKQLLYKLIRHSKGKPWPQLCQDVVDQINARPLKKLNGRSPASLNSPFMDQESRTLLEEASPDENVIKETALEEGALVLIDFPKDLDLRSYDLQRGEIKKVKSVNTSSSPYTYTLETLDEGEQLPRKYYRKELREVSHLRKIPKEIETVYRSRRKNKRKEYLVSYYNSSKKHWIPERVLYAF